MLQTNHAIECIKQARENENKLVTVTTDYYYVICFKGILYFIDHIDFNHWIVTCQINPVSKLFSTLSESLEFIRKQ